MLGAQIYELQPDEPRPSRSWVLPSSARVEGIGTFRTTGLTLRNDETSPTAATVKFLGPDGRTLASRVARVGPLGFAQLNVGADLGVTGVSGATFVLSTTTPGGAFAAYASAIDRATGDPRTLLPR